MQEKGVQRQAGDIPLGLGMRFMSEPGAMEAYAKMSDDERESVISYIQESVTGEDAKKRIEDTISYLKERANREIS